jgi:hypothetical protein
LVVSQSVLSMYTRHSAAPFSVRSRSIAGGSAALQPFTFAFTPNPSIVWKRRAPSILSAAVPPPPLLTLTVTIDEVEVWPAASLARACNV